MKCVLIITRGERIEAARELENAGYSVVPYPSVPGGASLTDERTEEAIRFLGGHIGTTDIEPVRSLRASFIKALCDETFLADDTIVFGESDAAPNYHASHVLRTLADDMAAHSETDVYRLFRDAPGTRYEDRPPILFEDFPARGTRQCSSRVYGSHALIIPAARRTTIAGLLAAVRLPVDTALEYGASTGEISIRSATVDIFYQQPRITETLMQRIRNNPFRQGCIRAFRASGST